MEEDADICFMQPCALDERIQQQPTMGLLNLRTHCESMVFATRTRVFRWSLVSTCAAELKLTEGSKHRNKLLCTFAPRSPDRDASRATDKLAKRPPKHDDNCRNGMGIRQALPHANTEAAHKHASITIWSSLLDNMSNAASQQMTTEEPHHSKATTTLTAATDATWHGSALALPVPGGDALAPIASTSTSPRCTSTAEYAPKQEQQMPCDGAQPRHQQFKDNDRRSAMQCATPTVNTHTHTSPSQINSERSTCACLPQRSDEGGM